MTRGDVVTVALSGDYGKPRPAVIVQSNVLPASHPSLVLCPLTSHIDPASAYRLTLEPNNMNGLDRVSQVMTDKISAVDKTRVGQRIGRLSQSDMNELDLMLGTIIGLGDKALDA